MLDVIFVQFTLGTLLFFTINWIGKHSKPFGYISLSLFVRAEEAPTFNYLIRILSPIVYMLLTASILYALSLDRYVNNFYMVSFYYLIVRAIINIVTDTSLLLNWYRQVFYWVSILTISYYSYSKIIINKNNLLPDFTTLSNELWIIIFVFIYHISNKIILSNEETIKRKANYLRSKFITFRKEYGSIINNLQNNRLIILAYSILIYENFNRPYVIRIIENTRFKMTKRPHTLGIMQIHSKKIISDKQSVILGIEKITQDYIYLINNIDDAFIEMKNNRDVDDKILLNMIEYNLQTKIIELYNGGSEYRIAIEELMDIIEENFFNKNKDKLIDGLPADWFINKFKKS